ncbi:hypothetical protein ASY01nite_06520 [Acetobacter syzygii]|uniref:hypothetical protein n=1 Tax=Acetobacter syzygii TaxID=146476 RepID=UPI0005E3926A|nr:hypothetical protein [Acetobacter syzygii]GAN70525.1 hypothetical protein Absy_008_038 [Acetobacter syzygii]GBR65868.1 hypothetical protein AA0483_2063 [Acetobacter syzygii NRIC 0483]GEL55586.1 hypothetical protein ASY01nite_06520 [Acetobacter syzygii]
MLCLNLRFVRTTFLALSALALGVANLPAAHADTAREQQTKACKGDALRLCALAIPNEKKITACMERKKDKLSPACRVYFKDTPAHTGKSAKQAHKAKR